MSEAEQEYKQSFGLGFERNDKKARKALEHALDIRKFEIGLYWQRAAYFWALIAAAFAGYFVILGSKELNSKEYLAFTVSCIGLIFTWAWFLVNRGSKQWQENWENHVDTLEDDVIGPLYKTLLQRPKNGTFADRYITGPAPISVSKINQWVSTFSLCIWVALVSHALIQSWFARDHKHIVMGFIRHFLVGTITITFVYLMGRHSRTHTGPHVHVMFRRRTSIE